jgi:hypothetical protein
MKSKQLLLLALLLISSSLAYLSLLPRIVTETKLPFVELSNQPKIFEIKISLEDSPWSPKRFHIVPDDCLMEVKINSQKLDLHDKENLCSPRLGLDLDLRGYLKSGANRLVFKIKDLGDSSFGPLKKAGFNFYASPSDPFMKLAFSIFVCGLLILTYLGLRFFNFKRDASLILLLALLIRLIYFYNTDPLLRANDAQGHLAYVQYISEKHALPQEKNCIECFHLPVYYSLAAVVARLSEFLGVNQISKVIQFFSVVFSFLFLCVAAVLIEGVLPNRQGLLWFLLILCFWPSGIIVSSQVGNEILFSLFYVLALLFFKKENAIGAGFLTVLAILTKMSGMLLIPMGIIYFSYEIFYKKQKKLLRNLGIYLSIAFLGVGAFFSHAAYNRTQTLTLNNAINGEEPASFAVVDNKLSHFLIFDPIKFIKYPDAGFTKDENGRQYFWNYLLKTSLFGQYEITSPLQIHLARLISLILIFYLPLMAYGAFIFYKKGPVHIKILLMLNFIILISALMALRLYKPVIFSNDFRYIFPSLISISVFLAAGLETFTFAKILTGAFTLLSILFILCY